MKHHLFSLVRFFLYGFLFFGACGVVLESPYIGSNEFSIDIIVFIALLGAGSFVVSKIACLILFYICRELTVGNN